MLPWWWRRGVGGSQHLCSRKSREIISVNVYERQLFCFSFMQIKLHLRIIWFILEWATHTGGGGQSKQHVERERCQLGMVYDDSISLKRGGGHILVFENVWHSHLKCFIWTHLKTSLFAEILQVTYNNLFSTPRQLHTSKSNLMIFKTFLRHWRRKLKKVQCVEFRDL